MHEELDKAISCIRMLKRQNKYEVNRIGKISIVPEYPAHYTYRVGDIVLFTEDGDDTITITRPWREKRTETHTGVTESVGAETITHLPKKYVEEYDSAKIPNGLYQLNYGIGRIVVDSIDQLVLNGHREAAFLLLLNVIAGLSRRRFPVPETSEGIRDSKRYRDEINKGSVKNDKDAFVSFVDEELLRLQKNHPEYGLDFNDMSFCTMDSNNKSVGEWIYY